MTTDKDNNRLEQRILCVDDEALFLQGIKRQFRRSHDLVTAEGGEAGLKIIEKEGPFAVIVSDYNMPGMKGNEFLRRAHELNPDAVKVMLTGNVDLDVAVNALHEGRIFRFLNKPCSREVLEETLNACLEQHRLITAERILTAELNQTNAELHELNENLEQRVEERTTTICELYDYISSLSGLDSVEDMAELVVRASVEQLDCRRVSMMMKKPGENYLSIVASEGIPEDVVAEAKVPLGTSIAGKVYNSREMVVANAEEDVEGSSRYLSNCYLSIPMASASLCVADDVVGVLNLTDRKDDAPFDNENLSKVRTLARAAAVAIQNQVRLHERNEARDATILALAKLAEARDKETGAHLERVQSYCRLLCEAMARQPVFRSIINRSFIESIARSSPLHDIGKVGIPDTILLKPGKLTDDEFDIIKQHTIIGGDTLQGVIDRGNSQGFLNMGRDIAYYHHEKYDGTGYPKGLSSEAIPLSARIMAVADVYDALTSQRVYKAAMPHEKAAAIIRVDSGSHFDPDVVDAFIECESEFERVATELVDVPPKKADYAQACAEGRSVGVMM